MNVSINVKETKAIKLRNQIIFQLPSCLFLKKYLKFYKNQKINETLKLLKLIFCSPAQMNGKVILTGFM